MRAITVVFIVTLSLLSASSSVGAIIYVNSTADGAILNDDFCTLREAIISINGGVGTGGCSAPSGSSNTIAIIVGGSITTLAFPTITSNVVIVGPGAAFLTVSASSSGFHAADGVDMAIRGMRLTGNGSARLETTNGFLLVEQVELTGTGVTADCTTGGSVQIRWTTFENNNNTLNGGAVNGGNCTVHIRNSSFYNNTGLLGGALFISDGTVFQSTFNGNSADFAGGAIATGTATAANPLITITSSTIVGNGVSGEGSINGGVFAGGGAVLVTNSVVAANTTFNPNPGMPDIGPDDNVSSGGSNLIGNNTGVPTSFPVGSPNANRDFVGTSASPLDPRLDALADNGGPTLTMLPQVIAGFESPLIDAGTCPSEFMDQRGGSTPIGGVGGDRRVDRSPPNEDDACDIGAVERGDTNFGLRNLAVRARVWLEGPFTSSGGGAMNTDLTVPVAHPYTGSPWNLPPENNANVSVTDEVDWIVVHLFEGSPLGPSFARVASEPALLRSNGIIADAADAADRNVEFAVPIGMYWIVIDHRNHVAAMTAFPQPFEINTDVVSLRITGDLRNGLHFGPAAQKSLLVIGEFGLFAGDGSSNNQVQNDDKNSIWAPENGLTGYRLGDFNLNGQVQNDDKNSFWGVNNGVGTKVPVEQ